MSTRWPLERLFVLALLLSAVSVAQAQTPTEGSPLRGTEQQLLDPEQSITHHFGTEVAVVGPLALVSAQPFEGPGAVYEFVKVRGVWKFWRRLESPTTANELGTHIAFDGFSALISAPGTVYYYVRRGTELRLRGQLPATNLTGISALNGCEAAAAGQVSDTDTTRVVHVFDRCRRGGRWVKVATLHASDAAPVRFGASIDLSHGEMLIGAPGFTSDTRGSAYVYVRRGASWVFEQKLISADAAASAAFGFAVALQGRLAVIGDPNMTAFSGGGPGSGAAYVFVRSDNTWIEQERLLPAHDFESHAYGATVALSRHFLAIGAPDPFDRARGLGGSVYVYRREGDAFAVLDILRGGFISRFGATLSLWGRTLLVGAPWVSFTAMESFEGAAYAYRLPGDTD